MCNCLCRVIVLCGMMMKGREKVKPGAESQPALLAARFNVPIQGKIRFQQFYIHTYCGTVWNLIQTCDVQSSDQRVYISTHPSPEVENFQMRIHQPAGDRTPADMLPSEPARRAFVLTFRYAIILCIVFSNLSQVTFVNFCVIHPSTHLRLLELAFRHCSHQNFTHHWKIGL